MRLFEAIVEANHRALSGDAAAGLRPDEHADSLPVIALTCIDPRLNPLIPEVLGVREEQFIWLRNAGNIITGPLSSTMRSLALACAVKGGKEIAILGHTDCLVGKSTMLQLTDRFRGLGVDRARLPENLNEFFGLFASERQNVLKAADNVRHSPLIGPKVPVHGLLLDIATGKLEWLVNGYQTLGIASAEMPGSVERGGPSLTSLAELPSLSVGEMRFPEFKIGESPVESKPAPAPKEAVEARPSAAGEPGAKPKFKEAAVHMKEAAIQMKDAAVQMKEAAVQTLLRLDADHKFRIVGTDRKIYGPVLGAKIMEWIADGRIDWQTIAKVEGGGEWKPLSAWAVLSGKAPQPAPPIIQPGLRSKH